MKKYINKFLLLLFLISSFSRVHSEQIYVPLLAVFQDKLEDENNPAMKDSLGGFIKANLPSIVTVSMLFQNKFNELKEEELWEIYINKDNTFVLLLPHSFVKKVVPDGKDKLSILGFDKNYLTLIKSSDIDTFFKNDEYKNISINMSHFEKFFLKEKDGSGKKIDNLFLPVKMIFATGHGSADGNTVVGMKVEQYQELLKILNEINTQFLLVESCYAGGESLLKMHDLLLSKSPGVLLEKIIYPIVINATTAEGTVAPKSVKLAEIIEPLFNGSKEIIKNKQFYFGVPFSKLKEVDKKSGTTSIKDVLMPLYSITPYTTNLPSIHMPGTNSFFRAIDIDNLLILTYVGLQKYKIAEKVRIALEEKKKLKLEPSEEGAAKINEKEWIQKIKDLPAPVLNIPFGIKRVMVYPSVIGDIAIDIDRKAVPFISHLRGDGQHFIEKLRASKIKFPDLLKNSFMPLLAAVSLLTIKNEVEGRKFYGNSNIVWFIEELECSDYYGDRKITGLVIQKGIDGGGSIVAFRQGEDDYKVLYFDMNDDLSFDVFGKIDKKEYASLIQSIYKTTRAKDEAIKEASGGNENKGTVEKAYERFIEKMDVRDVLSSEGFVDEILSRSELRVNAVLLLRKLSADFVNSGQFEEALSIAGKGFLSSNDNVREESFKVYKHIFEEVKDLNSELKNKIFNRAIDFAKNSFELSRPEVINLWKILFGFGAGIEAAMNLIGRECSNFLSLWSELYAVNNKEIKSKLFRKTLEMAESGNLDQNLWNLWISKLALNVKKGQDSENAIKVAKLAIKQEDSGTRSRGFMLWDDLFDQKQGLDNMIEIAKLVIEEKDSKTRYKGFKLWDALFKQKQGLDNMIEIAKRAIKDDDFYIRFLASRWWESLIERGDGLQDAKEINNSTLNNYIKNYESKLITAKKNKLKEDLSSLNKLIMSLDQISEEDVNNAIAKATEGVALNDYDVSPLAIDLWKSLFKKDYGFVDAMNLIKKSDWNDYFIELLLRGMLLGRVEQVKKNENLEESIKDALFGIKSSVFVVERSALDLWEALFERGLGFEKAEKIENLKLQKLLNKYKPEEKEESFPAAKEIPTV